MKPKPVGYRETNVKKTFSVLMIVFLLSVIAALSYFYCQLISVIYNVNEP